MASPVQALSKKVVQIAENRQLGTFSQAYRGHLHQTAGDRSMYAASVGSAFSVTSLLSYEWQSHVLLPVWFGILLGTAVFLLVAIPGYLIQIAEREDGVYLFEHGIIHSRTRWLTTLRWTQIAGCEIDRVLDRCSLRLKDGSTHVIRNLVGYDQLGRRIKSAIGSEEEEPPRSIMWK